MPRRLAVLQALLLQRLGARLQKQFALPPLARVNHQRTGTGNNRVCKDFDEAIDLAELRHSAGLSFNWLSPIGPFTMSYAEPLNDKSGDKTDSFQITVGSVCQ